MNVKYQVNCWCCQGSIEVDSDCYKPYTCLLCHKGEHLVTELPSDEFECEVICTCKMRRIVFVKRKAALELFKRRYDIKCKGCKKKEVTLHIKIWKGGTRESDKSVTTTGVVLAKEWEGRTPKELVEEA